jgi:hypothetical protein
MANEIVYPDGMAKIQLSIHRIDEVTGALIVGAPHDYYIRFTSGAFKMYRAALKEKSQYLDEGENLTTLEAISLAVWSGLQWSPAQRHITLDEVENAIDCEMIANGQVESLGEAVGRAMGLSLPPEGTDEETQKKMVMEMVAKVVGRYGNM